MLSVHRTTLAVAIAMGLLLTTGITARADIDYGLANAGSQVPFSQLSDAIPTAWSLLNPTAVTGPAIGQPPSSWFNAPANLSEPGSGNPNPVTLGQIVRVGKPDGADRNVWGVYDRLAVVPIPVLMYFDNFSRLMPTAAPTDGNNGYLPIYWGQPAGIMGESSGTSARSYYPTTIIEVPEPATALLLVPAAVALVACKRRRD